VWKLGASRGIVPTAGRMECSSAPAEVTGSGSQCVNQAEGTTPRPNMPKVLGLVYASLLPLRLTHYRYTLSRSRFQAVTHSTHSHRIHDS